MKNSNNEESHWQRESSNDGWTQNDMLRRNRGSRREPIEREAEWKGWSSAHHIFAPASIGARMGGREVLRKFRIVIMVPVEFRYIDAILSASVDGDFNSRAR